MLIACSFPRYHVPESKDIEDIYFNLNIEVYPTIQGIEEGKDVVLDRALDWQLPIKGQSIESSYNPAPGIQGHRKPYEEQAKYLNSCLPLQGTKAELTHNSISQN